MNKDLLLAAFTHGVFEGVTLINSDKPIKEGFIEGLFNEWYNELTNGVQSVLDIPLSRDFIPYGILYQMETNNIKLPAVPPEYHKYVVKCNDIYGNFHPQTIGDLIVLDELMKFNKIPNGIRWFSGLGRKTLEGIHFYIERKGWTWDKLITYL